MSRAISSLFFLVVCLSLLKGPVVAAQESASRPAATGDRPAARLLPESTVLYIEITDPKLLLGTILDHPLRQQVEQIGAYRQIFQTPDYAKFRLMLTVVEAQLGMNWRTAIETVADGGIYFGLDLKRKGGALLIEARDEKSLKRAHRVLLGMARGKAKKNNKGGSLVEHSYRGLTGHKIGDAFVFTHGRYLVAVNSADLARAIVDNMLDEDPQGLSAVDSFQQARRPTGSRPTAWAFLHLDALRKAGLGKGLYADKSGNPGLELLVGGILGTLKQTPYATASLDVEQHRVRLSLATPYQSDWIAKKRQHYFGPAGRGAAPRPLRPESTLLSLETHRDLGGMWLAAADLFNEEANAKLVQAESNLSTLFSGRDFGEEVLGTLRPEIQFVLARQNFGPHGAPAPQIKLPAGAAIFRLKNPDQTSRRLKVSFQSLVGFLNITGGQNGLPPLELSTTKTDQGTLIATEYLVDDEEKKDGKIHHNFSPTMALSGDRLIIASTKQLGAELLALCHKQMPPTSTAEPKGSGPIVNTNTMIDLAVLRTALDDNRQQLVAQNMLSEGHAKAQAEKEIGLLLQLLGYFKAASLRLSTDAKEMRLEFSINVLVPSSK